MDIRRGLGRSLRVVRKAQGVTQQDLADVTARSYLSYVERGVKNPTVEKLEELASGMRVHPLTILTIAYLPQLRESDLDALQNRIGKEARTILSEAHNALPRKARGR
jgi:transcriptional regulator with XRE-family HTH domain